MSNKKRRDSTRSDAIASMENTVKTTRRDAIALRHRVTASLRFRDLAPDYALLGEKDFSAALQGISDLGELEGLANRRKILNAPQLLRWSERQREQIIERKFELQKENAK